MPIINILKRTQRIQKLLLSRLLNEFNNENDALFIFIISYCTGVPKEEITYIGKGSYGVVYANLKKGVIYKCQKIFDKDQFIERKYTRTRQMYPHEQKMHQHLYNFDNSLTCKIFEPIIFGPLIIIRLDFLTGYVGLNQIRKGQEHNPAYYDKIQILVRQIIDKTKQITAANVYHGDHKDNNIMVHPETNDVKIIDFGKAKFMDDIKALNKKYYGSNSESRIDAFQNFHYSSILQYVYNEQQCPIYWRLFPIIDSDSIYLTIMHCLNRKPTHIFPFNKQKFGNKYEDKQEEQLFVAQFIGMFGIETLLNLFMRGQCQNGLEKPQLVEVKQITYKPDPLNSHPQVSDLMDLVEYCEINLESLDTPRQYKTFMRTRKGKFYMSVYLINGLLQWDQSVMDEALSFVDPKLRDEIKSMAITCDMVDNALKD